MKILVVDDNPDNVEMMVIMLNSQNYDVETAYNGVQALKVLRSEDIDLIISDILMPVMDGFQLCRECKKDEKLKKICFIFYTATYIDHKDEEFALSLGAQKFMIKPQEPDVFLKTVNDVIEKCKLVDMGESPFTVKDDKEVLQLYSERLVHKLEKRNLDLENEIASHKITEMKLQESEERFALAVEGTLDGLWDWNLTTDYAYHSDRYARMLGYEPGELPNSSKAWSDLLHPDDKEIALKKVQDYFNRNINIYDSIFRLKTKAGSYRWINARGKAVFDKDGKPYRFVCFHSDITEKKEQELLLIKTKEKAEESDKLKTAFLANLSHEVRTPMNGIKGFIGIMRKVKLEDYEQEQYLGIIEKSSNQLLELVTDLVEISKLNSEQIEPELIPVNIFLIIDNLSTMISQNLDKTKNLNLRVYVHSSIKEQICLTDEYKLTQILKRLTLNAVKFTQEGTIEICCQLNNNNEIEFSVKDTGIGIAKDKQNVVFNSFRQIETDYSQLPGGTGIGLSIAKAYVELLGGRIWLDSTLGVGSQFYFTIPFHPAIEQM